LGASGDSLNVARFLSEQAQSQPHGTALLIPRRNAGLSFETYSFSELDLLASAVAQNLSEQGWTTGTRTLLMVRPGLELILLVFALFKIGAVPVVIDPGMGLKAFLRCVRHSEPEGFLGIPLAFTVRKVFRSAFRSVRCAVRINPEWLSSVRRAAASGSAFPAFAAKADDPAAVLFTSGSTGAPKGVNYTHGMFAGQVASLKEAYAIQSGEVDFPFLPIFALFNPALGAATVVPEVNPGKPATLDPAKAIEVMQEAKVTTSFGSPVIWRIMVDYCEPRGIVLPGIKRILMAGAAVPPALLRRCTKVFPSARIETPYGATEVLPVSSIDLPTILAETAAASEKGAGLCVGHPFPGVEVRILPVLDRVLETADLDQALRADQKGEIVVTGPTVTQSYDRLPEATRISKVQDSAGRTWHRMGDIGYLDAQGRLWFCGRKVERVESPQGPLDPECCETFLNRHPEVLRSALVSQRLAGEARPVLAVELKRNSWWRRFIEGRRLERELLEFFRRESGIAAIQAIYLTGPFPVDVRHNAKIHRLSIGKSLSR
jgi:acyl-CoA synthetase (AMP-forming)/AMP-acid ligase II